jgi:RNA polymerase sigma-70 factor (ECF subfamily)
MTPTTDRPDPARWLDEHGDALYSYALARLRQPALAEDLVQETLLAAVQAQHSFAGRSSVRTWLISILKNKLIDHWRRTAREPVVDARLPDDDEIDALFLPEHRDHWRQPPSPWADPDKALEQEQFFQALQDCLDELPEKQGQAIRLCAVDGHSAEEACKVLAVSTSNLWVLLHRARLRLRGCLSLNWFEPGANN